MQTHTENIFSLCAQNLKYRNFEIVKVQLIGAKILKLLNFQKKSKMFTIKAMRAGTSGLERLIVVGASSTPIVGLRIGFWFEIGDDTAEQV